MDRFDGCCNGWVSLFHRESAMEDAQSLSRYRAQSKTIRVVQSETAR